MVNPIIHIFGVVYNYFLKGVKMKDNLGPLTGKGKTIRVLPQKELNKKAVVYYIEQVIQINSRK